MRKEVVETIAAEFQLLLADGKALNTAEMAILAHGIFEQFRVDNALSVSSNFVDLIKDERNNPEFGESVRNLISSIEAFKAEAKRPDMQGEGFRPTDKDRDYIAAELDAALTTIGQDAVNKMPQLAEAATTACESLLVDRLMRLAKNVARKANETADKDERALYERNRRSYLKTIDRMMAKDW